MKDFDAVVFDMDGVIFDSERACMNCWIELAEKYGIKDIETPYYACIGVNSTRTREIMMEAYGEDFPYDKYAKDQGIFLIQTIGAVIRGLTIIKNERMGIPSNYTYEEKEKILNILQNNKNIGDIITINMPKTRGYS